MTMVSIVICTRNRADQLASALQAIKEIRSQHSWECVVVNNGSTDHTEEVLARAAKSLPNLRSVVETRVGLGAGRDRGWREARGDIIAFTDDDCYVTPNYIDATVSAFGQYSKAGCIGGRILLHDPDDAPITIDPRDRPFEYPARKFVHSGALQGANLIFRRSALEDIGGIDPEFGAGTPFPCEDIDAVAATLWAGYVARFDPRIVVYHHHRRKESDIAALLTSYAKGSGAYYAKYMLRTDSRWEYLKHWLADTSWRTMPVWVTNEIQSMRRYLLTKEKRLVVAAATPILFALIAGSWTLRWISDVVLWARGEGSDLEDADPVGARQHK